MANNNLLFIVLIVAAVLLLNGGLTGGVVNYQLPQVSKYIPPKISIPAASLPPLEQSQETKLAELSTRVQDHYISLVKKDVSITNKLDIIGENTALSADKFGCSCLCKDGPWGAYGKACIKACVVSPGSPGGDQSSVCDIPCKAYCGADNVLSTECKAECTNPPV